VGPTGGRYPHPVLAQQKTDPPVANRAQRRARKRKVPLAVALVPIGLVVVGVVLVLVLGGGDAVRDFIPGGDDGVSDETPPFEFRLSRTTQVVATDPEAEVESLRPAAEAAGADGVPVLDELYTNAYLDPTNWREGDYEEILELFTEGAAASVTENVETITLGAAAGDVYETVTPRKGSLRFSVLFDPEGGVDTIVVRVRFYALGEGTDGTFTSIVSAGQIFLNDVDGWKITAFDLRRADRETEAPTPDPAPSGSASVSGSPSA
jgi:hypothetical protein